MDWAFAYRSLLTLQNFTIVFAALLLTETFWPAQPLKLKDRLFHFKYVLVILPIVIFSRSIFEHVVAPNPAPIFDLAQVLKNVPLPKVCFILIASIVMDVAFYWAHRLMHILPILWPIHKLHHMDDKLNAMTFPLNHIFDIFVPLFILSSGCRESFTKVGSARPHACYT